MFVGIFLFVIEFVFEQFFNANVKTNVTPEVGNVGIHKDFNLLFESSSLSLLLKLSRSKVSNIWIKQNTVYTVYLNGPFQSR